MLPAAMTFAFDPVVRVTETASIRLETIGLAVALFLALVLAAAIGRRTPAVGPYVPAPGLRPDDLAFIVVGAVPGAIVGGRLGYVLDHLDYYASNTSAIADISQGGATLTLAVPLGLATGAVIARLIGAPVGRWMHASAVPLLVALGAGKLAGLLGATGQGTVTDLPWATAYLGPGPWASLGPAIPAHPAQVYEALLVASAIALVVVAGRWLEVVSRRDGAALYLAVGLWAIARLVVAVVWRDPPVLGPLRAEQLQALLLLGLSVAGFVERWRAPLSRFKGPSPERLESGSTA